MKNGSSRGAGGEEASAAKGTKKPKRKKNKAARLPKPAAAHEAGDGDAGDAGESVEAAARGVAVAEDKPQRETSSSAENAREVSVSTRTKPVSDSSESSPGACLFIFH